MTSIDDCLLFDAIKKLEIAHNGKVSVDSLDVVLQIINSLIKLTS